MPPRLSVIIALRSDRELPRFRLEAAAAGLPPDAVEAILVAGDTPSKHRTAAALAARGEVLYFLDDDSLPRSGSLATLLASFAAAPEVAGIGGPAVAGGDAGFFEYASWLAMSSAFGQAGMARRFRPGGGVREAGEAQLIACNLAIRRRAWLEMPLGFDERLYPNEENELISRFQRAGARFAFHPGVVVERCFANGPSALVRRFYRYGKSRIMHFRVRPGSLRPAPLAPPLWVGYLVGLAVVGSLSRHAGLGVGSAHWAALLAPLISYGVGAVTCAGLAGIRAPRRRLGFAAAVLAIFAAMHLAYGIGAWAGVMAPLRRRGRIVGIRRWLRDHQGRLEEHAVPWLSERPGRGKRMGSA